jgi:hypothetical protein
MKAIVLAMLCGLPVVGLAGPLSSDLRGRVVDASGHPVAGATLWVEHLDSGRRTRHVSNDKGRWHALGLRSDGTYRVTCIAPGEIVPAARFTGRLVLGKIHRRNCVVGTPDDRSPAWLSAWSWRQTLTG